MYIISSIVKSIRSIRNFIQSEHEMKNLNSTQSNICYFTNWHFEN